MDERWESLVAGARAMMAQRQPATFQRFGLNYGIRYEWNLDRGEMVFSRKGMPVVTAKLHYLGTFSPSEGTWLWGWANETIPPAATTRLGEIRRYGEEQGFSKLTTPEWVPEGNDCHDVMIASAGILGAEAFFHDHYADLGLFFVLDGFRFVAETGRDRDR